MGYALSTSADYCQILLKSPPVDGFSAKVIGTTAHEGEMVKKDETTFAGRIKLAMDKADIRSAAELGRRMGLSRQTAHSWLNGDREVEEPELLFGLADALGVNPRWLMLGRPHPMTVGDSLTAAERKILDGYRRGNEKRRAIMEMLASPSATDEQLGPGWTRPDKRRTRVS